ncbi:MAG TPA: metallophosphoesterase [Thermomicrobiales bacterium]|nr:metallophosphoesterase [Thermomicrobiales bacterium]
MESIANAAIPGRSIRIAAIGDLHVHNEIPGHLVAALRNLEGQADLLVITGDLTEGGKIPEMRLTSDLLADLGMPKIAVLGNHDRRGLRRREMRLVLERAGVALLDGESHTMTFDNGVRLGFAGIGGYGGGFWPEEVPDLVSARISKAVALRARRESVRLEAALQSLAGESTDANLVVMHYSPTVTTLGNEPPLKYWMLGNSLLGKVIDNHQVDLVLHGHAHLGNYEGQTLGGIPVRNVAAHVTGKPMIFDIHAGGTIVDIGNGESLLAGPVASSPRKAS